jgi:hypothetical protein
MKIFFAFLLFIVLCVYAQKPKVSFRIATQNQEAFSSNEYTILRNNIMGVFSRSGEFQPLETSSDALFFVSTEIEHQQSGAVSDSEILGYGGAAGAEYLCLISVISGSGIYQININYINIGRHFSKIANETVYSREDIFLPSTAFKVFSVLEPDIARKMSSQEIAWQETERKRQIETEKVEHERRVEADRIRIQTEADMRKAMQRSNLEVEQDKIRAIKERYDSSFLLVPFGAPQFYNEQYFGGMLMLLAQGAGLGAGIAALVKSGDYHDKATKSQNLAEKRENYDKYNDYRKISMYGFIGFGSSYILSIALGAIIQPDWKTWNNLWNTLSISPHISQDNFAFSINMEF